MNEEILFYPINSKNYSVYNVLKKMNFNIKATSDSYSKYINMKTSKIVNRDDSDDLVIDIDKYNFTGQELVFVSAFSEPEQYDYLIKYIIKSEKCNKIIYFGSSTDLLSEIDKRQFKFDQKDFYENFDFNYSWSNTRFSPSVPVVYIVGIYENFEIDEIAILLKKSLEDSGLKVVVFSNTEDLKFFGSSTYSPKFMSNEYGADYQINELNEWFKYIDSIIEPDIIICAIPHGPDFMNNNIFTSKGVYLDIIKNILQPNYLITVLYDLSLDYENYNIQKMQLESFLSMKSNKCYLSNATFAGIPNNGASSNPIYIKSEYINNIYYKINDENKIEFDKLALEINQLFSNQ